LIDEVENLTKAALLGRRSVEVNLRLRRALSVMAALAAAIPTWPGGLANGRADPGARARAADKFRYLAGR